MKTMLRCSFLIFHIVLHANHIEHCAGGAHSINSIFYSGFDGSTFLDRTLFTRNETVPKSYVVGFKYVNDAFSRSIYHGIIHSDAPNTWGGGDISTGFELNDTRSLDAHIHIPNATKFEVGIQVSGMRGIGYTGAERWLRVKIFRPRSCALICAINKNKPRTKYQEFTFGERNDGDTILYAGAESFISSNNELPRHNIEFEDSSAILTAASIRLNSKTVIVFHNKVQLTDHRFSATIYGLKRARIPYVVIIYGHRN